MRLFQNSALYPAYVARLAAMTKTCRSFDEARSVFLSDRFGACHFLLPVLRGDPDAFFTNGDDASLQRMWAAERGLPRSTSLPEILLAQIEHHRSEVFYNLDPMRYGSGFLRRLPGCVRMSIAWRAAPSRNVDLSGFDLLVCNFPGILANYRAEGLPAAWLAPAHDPEMDAYAARAERPVDVAFAGGYSRHHRRRAEVLEAVASCLPHRRVVLHLDRSRLTRLAEHRLGYFLPVWPYRRPKPIRHCSGDPVFGRSLYEAFGTAKIVLNGAVDMAGDDRGNMRCFEAMGCGAALLSDAGRYPAGMDNGSTILTYASVSEAVAQIESLLNDDTRRVMIAEHGFGMVRSRFSKQAQWSRFKALVAGDRSDPPEARSA